MELRQWALIVVDVACLTRIMQVIWDAWFI